MRAQKEISYHSPGSLEREFGIPIPGRILPPEQWAKTAYKKFPPPGPLDFAFLFGRAAPLVMELGCGNGRYTLQSALTRPDHDHFSSDLLPAVIRYATRRANQRGLSNVRFAVKDAQSLLRHYVGAGRVREIHVYHPQPFHDPRDLHLRLITPTFLAEVWRVLEPGGVFVVQTDCPEYWQYMRAVSPAFFAFNEQHGPWPDAPLGRSRREILSRLRGLEIFRGFGARRDELTPEQVLAHSKTLPAPTFRTRGLWCDLDAEEAQGCDAGGGQRRRGGGPGRGGAPKKRPRRS